MPDAVPVKPLVRVGSRDWDAIRRTFRGRPAFEFGQSWRDAPEALFASGRVRVALSGMSLAVFADFRDLDVFNPVEHFNVAAFPHGDVFEIFLRPRGQQAYFEFHITPGATLMQMRWPGPMRALKLDWAGLGDPLLPYKITRWRTRAQSRAVPHGWEVFAEIPMRRIFEDAPPWNGSLLDAAFTRYDYTRGRLRPVISATAPFREPDFHRVEEWHALELRFR